MEGLTNREAGELLTDVKYLKECCTEVQKDIDTMGTRNTAILTSVILLLVGVVTNLILSYAK